MKEKTSVMLKKKSIVCIIALFCNLLWGSAFPAIKTGYNLFAIASDDTASQVFFAGIRFFLAGILTLIIGSVAEKKPLIPQKKDITPILILSLFQTILQYLFFYIGLANTSGVKASVIESISVFLSIIFAAFIFKSEKMTVRKAVGCVVGFAGIIIINLGNLDFSASFKFTGEGFIIISAASYALSSGLLKKYSTDHDPVLLSGWQFAFGGAVMTIVGLALGGELHPDSGSSFLILLYLAFVSAAAYSLWGLLLKYNDLSKIAVYGFTNPIFGVILSAIILNEQNEAFGIYGIVALILVSAGIFIVNYRPKVPLKTKKQ